MITTTHVNFLELSAGWTKNGHMVAVVRVSRKQAEYKHYGPHFLFVLIFEDVFIFEVMFIFEVVFIFEVFFILEVIFIFEVAFIF